MATKATVVKSELNLGLVPSGRSSDHTVTRKAPAPRLAVDSTLADRNVAPDRFVERDGVKYAGTHLLIELWDAERLGDMAVTDRALRDAATAAGATLLHIHLHHFGPNAGLSGVAVLAESHISIHTWPERGYAAVDIFMCGSCDPYKSIPVLRAAFRPQIVQISEQKRGVIA